MKKKILKPNKISKTPPPGWPTEEMFAEIERSLPKDRLVTRILADPGPVERAKADLCEQFILYLQKEDITQRELAKRLDIAESRVSEILHYHFDQFTIDRLLGLLHRLRPGVTLKVA